MDGGSTYQHSEAGVEVSRWHLCRSVWILGEGLCFDEIHRIVLKLLHFHSIYVKWRCNCEMLPVGRHQRRRPQAVQPHLATITCRSPSLRNTGRHHVRTSGHFQRNTQLAHDPYFLSCSRQNGHYCQDLPNRLQPTFAGCCYKQIYMKR